MSNQIHQNEVNLIYNELNEMISIFTTDINGHFLFVNKNFCTLSEYSEKELIGQSARILKSGAHDEKFYKKFWMQVREGKTWRGVFCNKTKSGKLFWLDTIIKPIINENKQIEKFIGFRINVTDNIQNKLVMEMQASHLLSVSKLATVGEISCFIAHEINNPLTIMSLTIDALNNAISSDNPDMEKIKALSTKMNGINSRMAKIVLALRNFARQDPNAKMEFVKIKDIIDDVILLTEDIAKSNGTSLSFEWKCESNLLLECYKMQISQVLINLIKNACDAVQNGTQREVKIEIISIDETLELRVLNSGNKISPETAMLLFTPYYTTKAEGKGTGLGLTIATKILQSHHGQLSLDETNEQTCFVMRIPLKQP